MTTSNFGLHEFQGAQNPERFSECCFSLKDIRGQKHCKHAFYDSTQKFKSKSKTQRHSVIIFLEKAQNCSEKKTCRSGCSFK